MRTRSIRPEFWSDEKLAKVSRDARLLFVGLWNISDDFGVSKGSSLWLKGQLFPYDPIKDSVVDCWLKELIALGVIVPFDINGEKFLYIRNFKKYQYVDHPSKARNPEPPEDIVRGLAQISRGLSDETDSDTDSDSDSETDSICPKKPDSISIQIEKMIKNFHDTWNEQIGFYMTKYPGVDYNLQHELIEAWIKENPVKAKKKTNWHLFAQKWLSNTKPMRTFQSKSRDTFPSHKDDKPIEDWGK